MNDKPIIFDIPVDREVDTIKIEYEGMYLERVFANDTLFGHIKITKYHSGYTANFIKLSETEKMEVEGHETCGSYTRIPGLTGKEDFIEIWQKARAHIQYLISESKKV